jgi:hypothetical protein
LEVPAKTRFVTCNYCNARLEIHQSGSTIYSEVLESIDTRTEKIADDLETIKMQNDLEQLDRQWSMNLQDYQVRGRDGHYSIPSTAGAMIGGVLASVFAVIWIGFAVSMGAPVFFPMFGVVFLLIVVVSSVIAVTKSVAYRENRANYERQRHELMAKMNQRR